MIKYETIISNFDDKTTLYNWLRKVEEALKHASATNFVVNKKGNATLSFSITFADGTTLESGDIVLQQGESVDQARIASGILQLHLTNGTWLTAGNIKPVSNFEIDASQHLIVNYQDNTSQDLGAIFSGNVSINGNLTANSIIENMSGYTFTKIDNPAFTSQYIYCSANKQGNVLTLVVALKLTRIDSEDIRELGYFIVPNSVFSNLYPTTIGDSNKLDVRKVQAYSAYNNAVDLNGYINKGSTRITFGIQGTNNLTINTEYYLRYEVAFLLNDNLAS